MGVLIQKQWIEVHLGKTSAVPGSTRFWPMRPRKRSTTPVAALTRTSSKVPSAMVTVPVRPYLIFLAN